MQDSFPDLFGFQNILEISFRKKAETEKEEETRKHFSRTRTDRPVSNECVAMRPIVNRQTPLRSVIINICLSIKLSIYGTRIC